MKQWLTVLRGRPKTPTTDLVDLTSACRRRSATHPDGARRAAARDADARLGLVPRQRLAARAAPAPARPRRPLRVGLPDPAQPDVKPLDGPRAPTSDFTDLHAWAEVYLPGAGWIGLDPTSGLLAGEGHIPLACHARSRRAPRRSPASIERVRGRSSRFEMTRAPHLETPRVTQALHRGAVAGDRRAGRSRSTRELDAGDVRLTMGGEPTFVAIDDRDGAEWNTAALGPTKRALAGELLRRLRERFAPRRPAALRPGQVVSRASRCRAGRSPATGAATASRSGATAR